AFLYLRALNTSGLWRGWPHHHPSPSIAFGVAILVCVLASAAVARGAALASPGMWSLAVRASLVLALAAVGLQAAQFSSLGSGALASVDRARGRRGDPARRDQWGARPECGPSAASGARTAAARGARAGGMVRASPSASSCGCRPRALRGGRAAHRGGRSHRS